MLLVETLLVRDEADVIDAHLAFHLNAGVDLIIVIDHDSRDGTTEILERYAREGLVHVISESGQMREVEWRTRIARIAAVDHGADWVLNADADQFWWPRGGNLRDVLDAIPARFRAVRAFDRVFPARPDDGAHFAERMTYRLAPTSPVNAPGSTSRPLTRVLHRGDPSVVVARGSHTVSGSAFEAVPNWHPIEVLHFPWRTSAQMARKAEHLVRAFEGMSRDPTVYHAQAWKAVSEARAGAHFATLSVDDLSLERGLEEGVLVVDPRLRDALRALAGVPSLQPAEPACGTCKIGRELRFVRPAPKEEAEYAVDAAVLREADAARALRLLDGVERRIESVERGARRADPPPSPSPLAPTPP